MGKKKLIYQIIAKLTNFDPAKSSCDWSTESLQLNVPNAMVISFMNIGDFEHICSKLPGKKTVKEVLMLIVNPNDE